MLPTPRDVDIRELTDNAPISVYRYGDGTLHPTNDFVPHDIALNADLSVNEAKSTRRSGLNGIITPSHPALDGDELWTIRSPYLTEGPLLRTAVIKKDTLTGEETVWARLPRFEIGLHQVQMSKNWFVVVEPSQHTNYPVLFKEIIDWQFRFSDLLRYDEQKSVKVYLVHRRIKNLVRTIDLHEHWTFAHIKLGRRRVVVGLGTRESSALHFPRRDSGSTAVHNVRH